MVHAPFGFMYSTADSLPIESLDTGSYLLSGPAMSGKYDLLVDVLIEGLVNDEAGLFVTTNQDAEAISEDFEGRVGQNTGPLRFVDCVSDRQGGPSPFDPGMVEYVSSPADLTGIGIGVSEQLRRFAETEYRRTRVGFYSLSTLLMYAELETVFRFLHVLTGRIESIEGLGMFAIDPTTHDRSTINTLKQLYDGMIELRAESDTREVRLVGTGETSGDWVSRA
jgi:KaiC/GvpD/RAD55 family RecA-like ATPase